MVSFSIDGRIEQRYKILCHIGSGAYGVVWCALDRVTKMKVAIKKVYDAFGNRQDAQRTYREVMLLSTLQLDNIVPLLNVIRSINGTDLYLVFELAETDLSVVLRHNIMESVQRQYVAYQIVYAVAGLHARGVIHRDLKPANVFLNSDCNIKLGDFGLARCFNTQGGDNDLTEYIATRWYRSPEVLVKSTCYTTAMDMWAVGCILGELFTGSPLFTGNSTLHQIGLIVAALGEPSAEDLESLKSEETWPLIDSLPAIDPDPLPERLSKYNADAVDLICKCIVFDPNKRPTAREALQHPYFAPFTSPSDFEELDKAVPIKLPFPDEEERPADQYRSALYDIIGNRRKQKLAL
ncbi:mitogen-activated protein kinase 1, putative [Trypanosoma equiperdum]|uniref:Mitogen-activated protein kinase n=5 Tax=Trypanozoon TaxID=39700 RepID=Q38AI6_TRYB2|nr:protein kinase, putative [Trypanosoma brucei gambiense DAL972]XP_823012.1 protein kinase, putative [Trypanosoma brucei brucei TREU927]AAA19809.1 protein kinase [Trypanosoma brucei]RHW69373.1 mitogen-activated protein kinase 1 [Trypanosoma brucei equiperdum]SCU65512.1 mitogen-activated protein kinase 1, putative [Trypanosoma equiperdum]EAN78184.1 protein kinase, putative [Trypanosoma brucei brucei TREU927]CBH15863.1 protein kinase, putative [Trypanosoma brucei gambiense DAL972]|eukprot:XP_011778127.1 protein kinase, putative [Trypanosoma brucei gambiense DAL972]